MTPGVWAPSESDEGQKFGLLAFVLLAGMAPQVAVCAGNAGGFELVGRVLQYGLVVSTTAWAIARGAPRVFRWAAIVAGVQGAPMLVFGGVALLLASQPAILGAEPDSPNIALLAARGQLMLAWGVVEAGMVSIGVVATWRLLTKLGELDVQGPRQRIGSWFGAIALVATLAYGSVSVGTILAQAML